MAINWEDRIILDPDVVTGKPVIKGTRLTVELIVGLLAEGWSDGDILDSYPGLVQEDIRACLHYAGARVQSERVYPLRAG